MKSEKMASADSLSEFELCETDGISPKQPNSTLVAVRTRSPKAKVFIFLGFLLILAAILAAMFLVPRYILGYDGGGGKLQIVLLSFHKPYTVFSTRLKHIVY